MFNLKPNTMKTTDKEISDAKELLEKNGFFTKTLWSVSDVMINYDCTIEEAQKVLENVFKNEATNDQIWLSIDVACEEYGLTKIEGE